MAIYGYHRTSTKEQNLDRGVNAIKNYCRENNLDLIEVFTDQQTGKNFDRPEYMFLRKRICKGDILILSELDRLARQKQDILKELQYFKNKDVRVMILELPTTLMTFNDDDTLSRIYIETINNLLIELLSSQSETEMLKREKRQAEGIQAMKDRGDWDRYGRPKLELPENFIEVYKQVKQGKIRPFEAIKKLGMKKSTYYKYKTLYEQGEL